MMKRAINATIVHIVSFLIHVLKKGAQFPENTNPIQSERSTDIFLKTSLINPLKSPIRAKNKIIKV